MAFKWCKEYHWGGSFFALESAMRRKNIVACLFACSVVALSGCALDEVFSLDVGKHECKGVKSLEIYTLDNDGRVVDRTMCSAGDECTKNNDYRGALEYGICPDDIPECRSSEKICSVCKEGAVFCGQKDRCIDPQTDNNHCGAKGFCNSSEKGENYEGERCDIDKGETCLNGECFSETACEAGVKYPICEGTKVVICDKYNKKKPTSCGSFQVCEAGACVAQPCDESYISSCDGEKRIYCDNGRVSSSKCGDQEVCVAGECKAKLCADVPDFKPNTCSADKKSYYTCDAEGRIKVESCNITCADAVGCTVNCDKDACYENPTEEQKKLLRVCKNGFFEDMDCEGVAPGMYCSEGKCTCTLGSQRCYQKVDQSWRVEKCVEEAGSNKWVTVEDCTSDKPICDDQEFYCHDEAQTIGSPCQMIVTDEQGKKHYCNNNNLIDDKLDMYCSDYLSGKEFSKFVTSTNFIKVFGKMGALIYGTLKGEIEKYDDFFVYGRNIFPKDSSVIKGCENVQVPAGMTLGCITSESTIVFKHISSFIESFKTAQELGVRIIDETLLDWLEVFTAAFMDKQGGFSFASPNGYCLVGSYDLTVRGDVFDTFFGEPKNPSNYQEDPTNYADGWNVLGFHDNPEEKLTGLVDLINTPTRHKEATKSKCPAGTVALHYTEPLMVSVDTDVEKDFIGRLGYDLCLKSCEKDADCRSGYSCLSVPCRAPDRFEKVKDVVDGGDFVKVCFNPETVERISDLRDSLHFKYKLIDNGKDFERDASGNLVRYPITKEDCAKDVTCKGSIERDWKDDNNHYEPAQ